MNLLARALPEDTTVLTFDAEHHANLLPWRRTVHLPRPRSPPAAVEAAGAGARRQRCAPGERDRGEQRDRRGVAGRGARRVAHRFGARIAVDAAQLAPHPGRPGRAGRGLRRVLRAQGVRAVRRRRARRAGRTGWTPRSRTWPAAGASAARTAHGDLAACSGRPDRPGTRPARPTCSARSRSPPRAGRSPAPPAIIRAERALVHRLRAGLADLPHVEELRLFGPDAERVGIVSFAVLGEDPGDLATAARPGPRDRGADRAVLRAPADPPPPAKRRRPGSTRRARRRPRRCGPAWPRHHRGARRPCSLDRH